MPWRIWAMLTALGAPLTGDCGRIGLTGCHLSAHPDPWGKRLACTKVEVSWWPVQLTSRLADRLTDLATRRERTQP
jgi:hypothetical protein